ncbi:MAG: hypothetical protein M5U19_00455 [Microthrixaceae bacterium]|nr:hypothetical protein [Microthrixaceae bacterium]
MSQSEEHEDAHFRAFVGLSVIVLVLAWTLPSDLAGIVNLVYVPTALTVALRRCLRLDARLLQGDPVDHRCRVPLVRGRIDLGCGRGDHRNAPPFPFYSDVLPLIAYVAFLVAIALIVHSRAPKLGLDPILDSLVGGISVAVLQWTLVVIPFLRDHNQDVAARSGVVVFSLMSLALVLAAVLALVAGSGSSTSNRLLAAGLVVSFITDVVATLNVAGDIEQRYVDIGTTLIIVLGGFRSAASQCPWVARPGTGSTLRRRLSARRISVLTFALITPPCLTIWLLATDASELQRTISALAAIVLAPLVLLRLGRLVHQNERLASQEGALRVAGEQLVESESDDDVAVVVEHATQSLLGSTLLDGAAGDGSVRSELERLERGADAGPTGGRGSHGHDRLARRRAT